VGTARYLPRSPTTGRHEQHEHLHAALVDQADCLVEYRRGGHYGAIDIDDESKIELDTGILTPLHEAGDLVWEWADPPLPAD